MKVLHLSTDDFSGGASRAAYRLHTALLQCGVDSSMRVLVHQTANAKVIAGKGPRSYITKIKDKLAQKGRAVYRRNFRGSSPIMHSFGDVSAGIVNEVNASDADVVHLHWIANLLSIRDIGKLTKPIVWTLHDMWAFCGGEHVVFDCDVSARFRTGYRSDNRPIGESGPDLNRLSWESKRQEWSSQRFEFIAPGKWMADCVAASALLKHHPTHTVPNPIELNNLWHPIDKSFARAVLGLDQQKKYVLSGSAGGMAHLKGEDLLNESLTKLSVHSADAFELLIFGQSQPLAKIETPFKTRWLGRVNDDHVMRLIYSASDVMAVPSRIDNLPNTAIEAHACGVPVVAFDVGGLPDIVDHLQSGWLAPAFDTDNFARGISWALQDSARWTQLSSHARKIAEQRFAPKIISEKYLEIYQKAIAKQRTTSQDV